MRPLKTILLCATMLLLAAGALAEQPPPEAVPVPAGSEFTSPMQAAATAAQDPNDPFPHRREQSNTIIQPGCVGTTGKCEARVDAMFLTLDRVNGQTMIIDQPTQWEVANTDDLHFNPELGPRITLDYQTTDGPIFEFAYFGIYNWNSRLEVNGNNNLALPRHFQSATYDFSGADRMQVGYKSRVNSVEANLIYTNEDYPNLGFLFGLRFMKLDEHFDLQSLDANRLSYYDIRTKNDLYGVQFGSSWKGCYNGFEVKLVGKAGVFDDEAKQSQVVTDANSSFVIRDAASRASRGVFMAEMNLNVSYCLRSNVYFNYGYDVVWVDRLVRAPDQLDFTLNAISGTAVVFDSGALMHGPHIGLEARW
jgi:hypothetical protein